MMRTTTFCILFGLLAVAFMPAPAQAAKPNPDVVRLSAQLEKLSADPVLGQYASAQRILARNAIDTLRNAGHRERDHALFMAEQRVELAEAAARVGADRAKLDQLQNRHDQIMLEASQADAAAARAELARQRLQYQAAVEQAQMLQAQGAQAAQQAQQAQAEAAQAKKLAAAQARAARLARREAKLAEAATQALQSSAGTSAQTAGDVRIAPISFVGKTPDLTAAGQRKVADFAHAHAHQKIVIQPRAASDWRVLAGRRAVAVRAALEAAGAGNVTIVGSVGQAPKSAEVELRAE
jgi:hypothetical protein